MGMGASSALRHIDLRETDAERDGGAEMLFRVNVQAKVTQDVAWRDAW